MIYQNVLEPFTEEGGLGFLAKVDGTISMTTLVLH